MKLLGHLPAYEPHQGFADRVMTRVAINEPAPVPVLSFPKLTRRRVAAMSALAAGICLSVAWSVTNRAVLDGWLAAVQAGAANAGWTAFRALAASVTEQPWYESLRQFVGTPSRVAMVATATLALYLSGLAALRRLITPSAPAVSNAGI
ncbi:MAG: hypothetical protein ACKVZ0_18355 [Gemmatimonadales bacterium]